MADDVSQYVRTCLVCQKDNSYRLTKLGLLDPLPVPKRPSESILLDFIIGFPKVGFLTTILFVVDWFSKYATFIAAQHVSTEETARLFFAHIVKYLGSPRDIVSDLNSRFTSNFWTELFKCLGFKLSHNLSFHP